MLAFHSTQNALKPLHSALLSLTFPVYRCGFSNQRHVYRQMNEGHKPAGRRHWDRKTQRDRRDVRSPPANNTGMNTQLTVALQRSGTHRQTPRDNTRLTGISSSNQTWRFFNQFNYGRGGDIPVLGLDTLFLIDVKNSQSASATIYLLTE